MATNSWILATGGNWNTPSAWSTGSVPNSTEDVVIDTSTVQTITLDSGNFFANSLTVGDDIFDLAAGGTLTLEGTAVATLASFGNEFDMNGGTLIAANTSKEPIEINGGGTLLSGEITTGSDTPELDININSTIVVGNITIAGQIAFATFSGGAVHQIGNITLPAATDVRFPSLDIFSGSTWEIEGGYTIGPSAGGEPGNFRSFGGTLAKASDADTALVDAVYADDTNSQIAIDAGTLEFGGAVFDVLEGTVEGGGTLAFGNGVSVALAPVSISASGLVINEATVDLDGALSYAGSFAQTAGSLVLASPLTLTGQDNFSGGSVDQGTLQIAGYAQTFGNVTVDDDATILDTGTIDQNNPVTLGSADSGQSGIIDITAGGTWHIGGGGDNIETAGVSPGSELINAGLLAMNASSGTSTIGVDVNSTGAIEVVANDQLIFNAGNNTFAGPIGGLGMLQIHGGTSTLEAGALISIAVFNMFGTLSLETDVNFGGHSFRVNRLVPTRYSI